MKLIVGLGNPGKNYKDCRHNIGFYVIEALAKTHKAYLKKENTLLLLSGKAKIGSQNVMLAMPLTFMNLSGIAISELLKKYRIDLNNLLVVCDDLDLDFGRLRLRPSGSSGGHQGLQSIINSLENSEFARLRIGIGRPKQNIEPAEYVLSPFNKREKEMLNKIQKKVIQCCEVWLTKGTTEAMNIFNKRSLNA